MPTPRILYIGAGAPWIGAAGYLVRQQMFLRALAECGHLHLALFNIDENDGRPPFPGELTALPMPEDRQPRRRTWLNDFFRTPIMFRHWKLEEAREAVRKLAPHSFDAVFSYRIDFAFFAGVLDHPRLLLDIDDPEHLRKLDQAKMMGNGELNVYRRLDLSRLRRFERAAAHRARAAFVCQQHDQQAFKKPWPIIVPNCVDVPPIRPERQSEKPFVLFVGNLEGSSRTPNVDGLSWFLAEVWPLILQRVPDCECQIVGSIRDSHRARLIGFGVTALGFVDRIEDVLMRASLSIAPIRFGTGTRVKILQSMASGCPVVTTPKGCEGLEVQHERELLIAANAADFADSCIVLLNDQALQERLAKAGHRLAAANYDRNRIHPQLVNLLARIIKGERPATI